MKEIEYIIDACETKVEVICALATVLGIGIMTALVLLTVNTWFGILYAFAFPWLLKAGIILVNVIDERGETEERRKHNKAWAEGYRSAIGDCKEAKENGEEWPEENLSNE